VEVIEVVRGTRLSRVYDVGPWPVNSSSVQAQTTLSRFPSGAYTKSCQPVLDHGDQEVAVLGAAGAGERQGGPCGFEGQDNVARSAVVEHGGYSSVAGQPPHRGLLQIARPLGGCAIGRVASRSTST